MHFHAPETLEEAAYLLDKYAGRVRLGAGCTYLMLMAARGEPLPAHLVSLHRVANLADHEEGRIGSRVTLRQLEGGLMHGPERALTMAASVIARPSVRNLATLGGNLGFADGDLIPAVLALDAVVHLYGGSYLPAAEYVKNRPSGCVATCISHERRADDGWTGATVKLTRAGVGWPVITVSVVLRIGDHGEILESRTAAQALAATPSILPGVDAVLVGSHGEPEALEYASDAALQRLEIRTDYEASAAYRRKVAPAVVRRALDVALSAGATGDVALRVASL
ncbi:MAG TPA: FAD binding domain-containing protein [Acidimicrobiales bacterium]|nr:FAD binding domain-containing protein [Acidimicrobiales bacterium]